MITIVVRYVDGRQAETAFGQRDMAAWERRDFGCSGKQAWVVKPVLFTRFLAWSAMRRDRKTSGLDFDAWSETVDHAEMMAPAPADSEDPGDELVIGGGVDPTRPGRQPED